MYEKEIFNFKQKGCYEWVTITVPGQTRLIKPNYLPDIAEDAFVEVYIDGRKVFAGPGNQYEIDCEGLLVQFAYLGDQEVCVRYTQ